ncbi:MAG TPA: enoyl-CoA hydratase-related protein [Acidimicrobiales bacterium]|nr:enoyl-CoA hydratase-related protein [Acidimicrobiales bacterium]
MEPDQFEHLGYHVDQGVALIVLNRPERHNAWSGPMAVEYRWALHQAEGDADVRVVVLTGAGESFCVGADAGALQQIGTAGGAYVKEKTELPPYPQWCPPGLRHNHVAPMTVSMPVIAAINGACAGVGFVLAAYADLRWASDRAKIATSFAALGLPAEYGIGWVLPRLVGSARALELLYDPAPRSAEEAYRLGFVQRVVPADDLLPEVTAYARRLARHSSAESLRTMKRSVLVDADGEFEGAYRASVADMDAALAGPDFQEGLRAQRAGERPDFLVRRRSSPVQVGGSGGHLAN